MLEQVIDIRNSKKTIKELASLVAHGTEIILMDGETPLARIVPFGKRIAGLHKDTPYWTSDDFDAPLSDQFWTGTE